MEVANRPSSSRLGELGVDDLTPLVHFASNIAPSLANALQHEVRDLRWKLR